MCLFRGWNESTIIVCHAGAGRMQLAYRVQGGQVMCFLNSFVFS